MQTLTDLARSLRNRALVAALLASLPIAVSPALAQPTPAASAERFEKSLGIEPDETRPWLYQGSEIPVDESWTFGELDNGLRYAVKHNAAPPDQVAIRIAVDAGSLHERDDELGYAHLLEHLSFRESEHVPDGEARRIWQRYGASFGSDTNAQTSSTQTVYQLDLPNITRDKLDESLQILAGMMAKPIFTKKGVNAEKAIVLAEKREREGPFSELVNEANKLFYYGQRLAARPVIGTDESIRAATPKKVRAFHDRWYRPENVVISIVGDVDPALLEEMIGKHFADWKAKGKPTEAPDFGDPVPGGPDVKLLMQPSTPQLMYWTITRPWRPVRDTFAYNEQNIVDDIALDVINRRLEAFARSGASFLSASVQNSKISRSAEITQMSITPEPGKWSEAMADARAFVADALNAPPSQADIDREVAIYLTDAQRRVDNYPSEPAAQAADSIPLAVDIRETVATPMVVQEFVEEAVPRFTPERIFEATKRLFTGDTSRLLMISPEPVEGGEDALSQAFNAPLDATKAVRVEQKEIDFDALPDLGPSGEVANLESYRNGQVMMTFDNGVKAFLRPRTSEAQSIRVLVRFGKGYRGFSSDEDNLLWSADLGLVAAGVGDLGLTELEQLAVGHQVGLSFGIDYDAFELSAETRPSDLEGQLRLLAAKLEEPRWDTRPLEQAKREFLSGYPITNSSPDAVLGRDFNELLSSGDKRFMSPTPADVEALEGDAFQKFWQPVLQQGPISVLLIGDFDVAEAGSALAATFGAMEPREAVSEAPDGDKVAFAERTGETVTRYHDGNADQAAAMIAWPGGAGTDDFREERISDILGQVMADRLIEEFRGLDGESYSPQAYNFWPEKMTEGGYFAAYSLVQPDSVPLFFERARKIAADLAENPISADELARAIEPQEQWVMRALTANVFWMNELEGITQDISTRERALVSLVEDYGTITPEEIRDVAAKYLKRDAEWRMQVLPRPDDGD